MAGNSCYTVYNVHGGFEQPDDVSEYFSLAAPPDSRIWRSIRSRDEFSAPMLLTRLEESFDLVEVTVSAPFEETFDQTGLVIFLDMSPDEPWISPSSLESRRRARSNFEHEHKGRWATVCLQQQPGEDIGLATTVAHPNCGPDMSVSTVPMDMSSRVGYSIHTSSLRIKLEKVNDALWVSYQVPSSFSGEFRTPDEVSMQWRKAREVTGFFASSNSKPRVMVGCYASRPLDPDEHDKRDFVAEFEDLQILQGP